MQAREQSHPDDIRHLIERAEGDAYEMSDTPLHEEQDTDPKPTEPETEPAEPTVPEVSSISLQSDYDRLVGEGSEQPIFERDWLDPFFAMMRVGRRWWFVAFVVLVFVLSIQWTYRFQEKQRQIDRLEKQVEDLHNRYLFTTAELVRIQRISSIESSVAELGLDLEHSSTPPYEVVPRASSATPQP